MARHDDIDVACRQPAHHGDPILLRAQGRAHLEERPVGADVILVEREVIDRHPTGDGQLALLGLPDHLQALSAAQGGGVIAPAGNLDQPYIALHDDGFGSLVHARQTDAGCHLARVHGGTRR